MSLSQCPLPGVNLCAVTVSEEDLSNFLMYQKKSITDFEQIKSYLFFNVGPKL